MSSSKRWRRLRILLDRLSAEVVYPYDNLDDDERGTWLVECLDADEVLNPRQNYSGNDGVDSVQRGLDSF